MLCADVLFNEESRFCMMPETFVDYSNMNPSPEDIKWAKEILEASDQDHSTPTAVFPLEENFVSYKEKEKKKQGGA